MTPDILIWMTMKIADCYTTAFLKDLGYETYGVSYYDLVCVLDQIIMDEKGLGINWDVVEK